MWVFPTPTGPCRMTDSPAWSQRSAARSRICAAGSFGLAAKSNPSRVAGLLEAGAAEPAGDGGGLPAGDLVLAEDLQELQVAEFAGAGLGQAGVEGSQHPDSFRACAGCRAVRCRRGRRGVVLIADRRAWSVRSARVGDRRGRARSCRVVWRSSVGRVRARRARSSVGRAIDVRRTAAAGRAGARRRRRRRSGAAAGRSRCRRRGCL